MAPSVKLEHHDLTRAMAEHTKNTAKLTSKYVHPACAHGHEAIQIATGRMLGPQDYLYAYYRDDAMLLALGMEPEELMLQLFAKADDPFSGLAGPTTAT